MKKQTLEKPILFTGKMVNAILDNKKFVTRRLVDPQPPDCIDWFEYREYTEDYRRGIRAHEFKSYMQPGEPCSFLPVKAKYWPGLRLWVRETWGISAFNNESGHEICVKYHADKYERYNIDLDNEELFDRLIDKELKYDNRFEKPIIWRPSIFLPRIASRITLNIINVIIERLHELDDIDAALEGCKDREEYIKLWNSINKRNGYPWEANPWVYRIQFAVVNDD
jgi:hypothetical protein